MAISAEAYEHLRELEKIENWTQLDDDDPRIVKLRLLIKATEKEKVHPGAKTYGISLYEGDKFIRAWESSREASEDLDLSPKTIREYARSGKPYKNSYRIQYIKHKEVNEVE